MKHKQGKDISVQIVAENGDEFMNILCLHSITHLALVIFSYFKREDIFLVIVITLLDYKKCVFYMKNKHSVP